MNKKMERQKKILLVFGTRPEAIKMAPLVKMLKNKKTFEIKVCITSQHSEMLKQVLDIFEIKPDFDLNLMKKNQDLTDITSGVMRGMRSVLDDFIPDLMLVHGDTTTTLAASLSAFYRKVKIGHIEAGLRTFNLESPWPEEANRQVTDLLSNLYFAPTELSKYNLIKQGINEKFIFVTGNTVIDALFMAKEKVSGRYKKQYDDKFAFLQKDKKIVLITGHRRENFGKGFENICKAVKNLAKKNSDVNFVYPVHLNPNVKDPVEKYLSNIKNIFLIKPLDYLDFIYIMQRSYIILTDSGGIQEEAPSLGKPVLVLRNNTERPEAVDSGTALLVGTKNKEIEMNANLLLSNEDEYKKISIKQNPYGDGTASKKIMHILENEKL